MKHKLTLALATLLLASGMARAAASSPLTVAVYGFGGNQDVANYSATVTTLVTADLTAETNLVLVERAELAKALSEQAFGVSGMVSPDAAAKIGQITGAKVLVAGQVMKVGDNHLVVVANIVGTETGRLFAAKVEGAADNLLDLTSHLSRQIAQTISDQRTNLIASAEESKEERLARIIKGLGTNRPTVSVSISLPSLGGQHSEAIQTEFGIILLQAGFTLVDGKADRKPDIEITGVDYTSAGPRQGSLYSDSSVLDIKVQERKSGIILAFLHQEASATAAASMEANRASQVNAVDALAERILPVLANQKYEP
jgi:TolB-like protein